jgi:hypothetical protein
MKGYLLHTILWSTVHRHEVYCWPSFVFGFSS